MFNRTVLSTCSTLASSQVSMARTSSFFILPAEVRNYVSESVFAGSTVRLISCPGSAKPWFGLIQVQHLNSLGMRHNLELTYKAYLGILRTCQLVRIEAKPILFRNTQLLLETADLVNDDNDSYYTHSLFHTNLLATVFCRAYLNQITTLRLNHADIDLLVPSVLHALQTIEVHPYRFSAGQGMWISVILQTEDADFSHSAPGFKELITEVKTIDNHFFDNEEVATFKDLVAVHDREFSIVIGAPIDIWLSSGILDVRVRISHQHAVLRAKSSRSSCSTGIPKHSLIRGA